VCAQVGNSIAANQVDGNTTHFHLIKKIINGVTLTS